MKTNAPVQSYDAIPDFGMLYDTVPGYQSRGDVEFYVSELERLQGPVLELGCGTGRVLLPIARSGLAITGIDSSTRMLERCRAKIADEPEAVRSRIALHQRDVRDFDLGATFGVVIAPFRVFQHLTTTEDQLRFLGCVAKHLAPGGHFILDVFNPHFAKLVAADGKERDDTPAQSLPDGRSFRRTYRVARVRWLDQINETELIYYVSAGRGAKEQRFVHAFDMRWYLRSELLLLLALGGFRESRTFGNFDRTPLTDDSPEQIMCVVRM